MPDRFFFEQMADQKKEANKIFLTMMVIITLVGGLVLYFLYTGQIESDQTFLETRCGFEEVKESILTGSAKDVGGVKVLIEQKTGQPNIQYLSLKPTTQCNNDVGMWFSNQNGSSMYAYCLGVSTGKLVEFDMIDCRKLDHSKAVSDSFDSVVNASRGSGPEQQSDKSKAG